jgi:hypothetical protein
VARRWLGVVAVVAVLAAAVVAVALSDRGGGKSPAPAQPGHVKPSQQYGDDADLMRRLERKKHVKGTQ